MNALLSSFAILLFLSRITVAGTVSGQIVNHLGQPLAGVAVNLDAFVLGGESGPWNATTGLDGRYSVTDGLLFGNVRVTPSFPGVVGIPSHRDLFFDVTATADFLMDLPGISGTVRDAANNAVVGITVSATRVAGGEPITLSAVTDAAGRYRIRSDQGLSGTFRVRPGSSTVIYLVAMVTMSNQEATANFTPKSPFALMSQSGLNAFLQDKAIWGDLGGDGLPDAVFFTGGSSNTSSLRLGLQSAPSGGTRMFSVSNFGTPMDNAAGVMRDFNNDGHLDLAVVGADNASFAQLYFYQGNGTSLSFARKVVGLIGNLACADVNLDGRLDLLNCGRTALSSTGADLWINQGNFQFRKETPFVGGDHGSFADVDVDGDPDVLVMSGIGGGSQILTRLHRNDGNLTFSVVTTGLAAGNFPTAAWGDRDADGLPDVALILTESSQSVIHYRNEGQFSFSRLAIIPTSGGFIDPSWGDLEGNGFPDLLEKGIGLFRVTRWVDGIFGHLTGPDFGSPNRPRYGAWVDVDGDRRLEIALTPPGGTSMSPAQLFRTPAPANAAPSAPLSLAVVSQGNAVQLTWQEVGDDLTPTPALTYNLRVGTTPGGVDVVSPMANASTGHRWIWERGPVEATRTTLKGLVAGQTYFWSVQAIDSQLAGGAWGAEQSFTVGLPEHIDLLVAADGSTELSFSTSPAVAWRVEFSQDLVLWQNLGGTEEPTPGNYFFAHGVGSGGRARGFYRVVGP